MIVFTLGTIFFPFNRAANWLQVLLEEEIINEPVLFQHGATSVNFKHPLLTSVISLTRQEMCDYIKQSSLVISHAGQGSTRMLAEMGATFILLPRLKRYGEHVDDHQLLFAGAVEQFEIYYCTEFSELVTRIKYPPSPYHRQLFDSPLLVEHFLERYQNSDSRTNSLAKAPIKPRIKIKTNLYG